MCASVLRRSGGANVPKRNGLKQQRGHPQLSSKADAALTPPPREAQIGRSGDRGGTSILASALEVLMRLSPALRLSRSCHCRITQNNTRYRHGRDPPALRPTMTNRPLYSNAAPCRWQHILGGATTGRMARAEVKRLHKAVHFRDFMLFYSFDCCCSSAFSLIYFDETHKQFSVAKAKSVHRHLYDVHMEFSPQQALSAAEINARVQTRWALVELYTSKLLQQHS